MRIYENLDSFSSKNPVVTIGMFDGVHLGHRQLLSSIQNIAENENGESVLLTFWPHPRMFFEKENSYLKLLSTLEEKIDLLKQTGLDSLIILPFNKELSMMSPFDYIKTILIESIGAKKIVIGYDHRYGYKGEGDFAYMKKVSESLHFSVEEIPAFDIDNINVSSSKIRKAIEEGHIQSANTFLSYDYFLNGTVVKGKQLGRSLGYPTANIQVDSQFKLVPGDGVYIVEVKINNIFHKGVLSIGTNPTIDNGNKLQSIEVFIFDFNENIYNAEVTVIFKDKIRDTIAFPNVEALKKEIENDVAVGRAFFNK